MKGKVFTAQEVQAIIAGNKTQFREVIKPQPNDQQKHIHKTTFSQKKEKIGEVFLSNHDFSDFLSRKRLEEKIKCPYQVGQKIFCKESFITTQFGKAVYRMDAIDQGGARWHSIEPMDPKREVLWKPAQHMKQEHSRLTLLIKEIGVERLGDISEEDCLKEGIRGFYSEDLKAKVAEDWKSRPESYLRKWGFKELWNATHKKPEEKFEASPWVWVVSFEVVEGVL